jgi:glutaminyl-tRNA synthetase
MRRGESEIPRVLRAKIDMASVNLLMRDPIMYRMVDATHHRTGRDWPIYPLYDWAHGLEDSIEGVTHSVCTLEFETHRPLYDWYLDKLGVHHPQQIEFARLNLNYTLMSKRKLLSLVEDGHVDGWDDPRLPTISGLRRRGYTPESIRHFCDAIGVSKINGTIEMSKLEFSLREDLNKRSLRVMAVLNPLKVVITNYPEGQIEELEAVNNPEDESAGKRRVPFGRELYIEREDFMEDAPRKFFRLAPGREVRLRYAYYVTCHDLVKDEDGNITELHCTYDPATKGGRSEDGRKVKGTLHWVSAEKAISSEVRIYESLFDSENTSELSEGQDISEILNPHSLKVIAAAQLEPSLAQAEVGTHFQFERLGYFCLDSKDHSPEKPVWNRTVSLKDSWQKKQKK